jgi:Zn-dependent protease
MEQYDMYPPKPDLVEHQPKSSLAVTIFSIVLFVMVFLLLFRDEINFVLYLVVVLLIHEMGHFLMMKLFKYENVRMLFVPLMGAFVQGKKRNYSQKQSFLVTLAGPIPGVAIGAVLMWYGNVVHSQWMVELSSLFLLLNLINLLPLDPLDGGQLFKLYVRRNYELFLMIFALTSSLLIIGLGWLLDSYIIMIFGFFMGFRVRALQKQFIMHKELKNDNVNFSTSYKLLSNRDFSKIKEVVLIHTPQLQRFVDQASEDESDPIVASQVNNVLITPVDMDASLLFRIIVLILWVASFGVPFLLYYTLDHIWLQSVLFFYH